MEAGVGRILGISEERCEELLATNRQRWVAIAPTLAQVPAGSSLEDWLANASRPAADRVLTGLAQLAAESGQDDLDAALVLAWALRPGADALIARLRDMSPEIDQHVSAHLWIEIRTFPWRTRERVAANILMRVRQRVLIEMDDAGQLDQHNRTLKGTRPVAPDLLVGLASTAAEAIDETPRAELEHALAWGCRAGVITEVQRRLLLDIVDAAHTRPIHLRANTRLLSDAGTDLVGQRWGMSGRKVRRLAKASIEALAAAVASAA
jgi:hypothetical protein